MNALYVTVLMKKALGELNGKLCALDMNANKYRKSTNLSTFHGFYKISHSSEHPR